MKLRWHLLFLLLATFTALALAWWLSLPIWVAEGYETIKYAGKNAERFELYSLSSDNKKTRWFMETHDWRTGRLLRKIPLEVSSKNSCDYYLDTSNEGEIQNTILLFMQLSREMNGDAYNCLLDGSTGKQLSQLPSDEPIGYGRVARHKNQLALALDSEIRLFRDKPDEGRRVALRGVRKLSFSPDGSRLACVNNFEELFLVDFPSGKIVKPEWSDQDCFDASFLRNGQLCIISMKGGNGSISQHGMKVSRWQCEDTKLKQIAPTVLLRSAKQLGVYDIIPLMEKGSNSLHIMLFQGDGWSHGLDGVFSWLTDRKIAVEKWFHKKEYQLCFELNQSNEVLSTYKKWLDGMFPLQEGLSANYRTNPLQGSLIEVYKTGQIWPWATELGVVVYVGLRSVTKGRKAKRDTC